MTPYESKLYFELISPNPSGIVVKIPFPNRSYISKFVVGQTFGYTEGFTVEFFNRDPHVQTLKEEKPPKVEVIVIKPDKDDAKRIAAAEKGTRSGAARPDTLPEGLPDDPGRAPPAGGGGVGQPEMLAPEDFWRIGPIAEVKSGGSVIKYFTGDKDTGQRPYLFVSHASRPGGHEPIDQPTLYVRILPSGTQVGIKKFALLVGGETFT